MIGDWHLWLLVAIAFIGLALFWQFLNFTFDLIEQAHQRLREQAEAERRLEDAPPAEGKVT